jgi:hypothetical protein
MHLHRHRRLGRATALRGSWLCGTAAGVLGIGALLMVLPRCNNGATAVDGCRTIEQTRCRDVQGCPGSSVVEDSDVSNCELFYRDECLFGMADGMSPDDGTVAACAQALDQARTCWVAGLTLGKCAAGTAGVQGPALSAGANPELSGCAAIMSPELLAACSFLAPTTATTTTGTGGSAGTGGSSGGGGAGGG